MNNEEKIIKILTQMQTDISDLKQGQTETNSRLGELEQGQTRLEVILETEVARSINLLVEGHQGVVERLDGLRVLNEQVIKLNNSDIVQNVAIRELSIRTAVK